MSEKRTKVAIVKPKKFAIFTICSNNYLAFAKTLMASLAQYEPSIDRFLILADEKNAPSDLYPEDTHVIQADELQIPNFHQFAFRYDVMEFNTALKPFAILDLLQNRGYDGVIYLDPDIEVFAPLTLITDALASGASVVLTPHVCYPAEGDVIPSDLQFLQAGTYNLGFCAWGCDGQAQSTLRWWARRLEHQCVNEVARGLFVDQKFIDLVPGFVDKCAILRNAGLNVAYWNLSQRELSLDNGAHSHSWTIDGQPLIFFHFSGFSPGNLSRLSKHTPMFQGRAIPPALATLMTEYAAKLGSNHYGVVPSGTYTWERFSSGTPIHLSVRRLFRERYADWKSNPFDSFEAELHATLPPTDVAEDAEKSEASPFTRHMDFLRDGLNWLQFMYDTKSAHGQTAFANWYIDRTGEDWALDPRLFAPTIARLSHQQALTLAPERHPKRCDVSLVGYVKAMSGVGEMARKTLNTLMSMPFSIEAHDIGLRVGGPRDHTRFDGLETRQISGRVQIFNINADQVTPVLEHLKDVRWRDGYKIAVPFWELNKFPAQFNDDLDVFDELWATSSHIHALLYRQFRNKPIYLMPPDLTPRPSSTRDRTSFGLTPDAFVVLCAFDFLSQIERKNPVGAYAAFQEAFPTAQQKNTCFVLKTLNAQYAPETYKAWYEELLKDPRVVIIEESLNDEDMLALIACANVVLSLHRGEGLGLLIADAIGQMVPVISTDWSGTTDLINQRTGYPVNYHLVATPQDAYPYVDGHEWAEPNLKHAAWHLQDVFSNPDRAQAKARLARAQLAQNFGPSKAASAMAQRLACILVQNEPVDA